MCKCLKAFSINVRCENIYTCLQLVAMPHRLRVLAYLIIPSDNCIHARTFALLINNLTPLLSACHLHGSFLFRIVCLLVFYLILRVICMAVKFGVVTLSERHRMVCFRTEY
jgi:hypothetical protein